MRKRIGGERLDELIRFAVNGGLCFLLEYGLLYGLTEYAGLYYLSSSAVSFAASVVLNYVICMVWVFPGTKNRGIRSKLIFVGSSLAGLLLNQLIMWFFVEVFGVYYMLTKIIATGVVMVWNYVMKRKALVV
ncbi:MAG: sugar translocase [Oscillospiraceae bacterium]|nr:sugar translocase [Oscillospiraceae bacterium]